MTTSKTTQQKKEEFLYPTPSLNPDADFSFLEMAQVELKKTNRYTIKGRDWGCDWFEIVDLREWTER